ncbi:uncharacterized protein EV422DRAFT_583768 [Fimicolochytrium jonesii]|uniref:uncharacterized protein n=1 Tax=Fimicolochytrium jonesii TaxID=1396493 RepID=UPI0022FE4D46|nr:uncharacterized protein EV422DRAFT_583768 [Fimicolochytrium jonesii]KAI8824866.1 hypothetical protein EV422DRAFT_583768 [Fimicolochytrium jonesii]
MESDLEEVAKHCHTELHFYTQCVQKHPDTWQTDCKGEKEAVTRCAEANVESLRLVKKACAPEITVYQACLKANVGTPTECVGVLRELYNCHNTVMEGLKEARRLEGERGGKGSRVM